MMVDAVWCGSVGSKCRRCDCTNIHYSVSTALVTFDYNVGPTHAWRTLTSDGAKSNQRDNNWRAAKKWRAQRVNEGQGLEEGMRDRRIVWRNDLTTKLSDKFKVIYRIKLNVESNLALRCGERGGRSIWMEIRTCAIVHCCRCSIQFTIEL